MAGAGASQRDLGVGAVYRRLARNSAYLAGGTVASALFTMLAAVLNARALSARDFGLLVLFQSATTMLAVLMSFSTQQPVIKLGATALAEDDRDRLGRILGLGLMFDTLAAIVAAALAFGFLALGRDWVGIDDDQLGNAALFAGSLLFTGYLTSNGIFRLLNRFGLLSLLQAGCAAVLLAVTAWLYASGAPFRAYCWTWAIFFAANAQLPLVVGLLLARRAGIPVRLAPKRMAPGEVPSFLAYCWTTWGVATIEALRSNGDSLLVGAMVSVEAAGVYNVAKQLAGVLRKANAIYASAMFPEVSALSAQGQAENARRVRGRILSISGVIAAAAIAAAVLAGQLVLSLLFGVRFEAAYWPLVILTAAAASQLISHTLSMYVQVYVGPERLFHVYVFAIILFAIAVFPLTAALSTTGTALAQFLFSLALIYFCHMALRRAGAA